MPELRRSPREIPPRTARPATRLLLIGHRIALRSARSSQAAVILAIDYLARDWSDRPRPLAGMVGLQLDLAGTLIDEPARLVDELYSLTQELLALHRDFAQRLFEAVESRDPCLGDRAVVHSVLASEELTLSALR